MGGIIINTYVTSVGNVEIPAVRNSIKLYLIYKQGMLQGKKAEFLKKDQIQTSGRGGGEGRIKKK